MSQYPSTPPYGDPRQGYPAMGMPSSPAKAPAIVMIILGACTMALGALFLAAMSGVNTWEDLRAKQPPEFRQYFQAPPGVTPHVFVMAGWAMAGFGLLFAASGIAATRGRRPAVVAAVIL